MKQFGFVLVFALLPLVVVHAWVTRTTTTTSSPRVARPHRHGQSEPPRASSAYSLLICHAGFGASDSKSKKKEAKLKPKQMWDRYLDLKKEDKVPVGVRVNDEWFDVGAVKSKNNKYTEIAVARQRGLLAEHARRLFPLQITAKSQVEWAYKKGEDDWVVVDKSVLDDSDVPESLEKKIGFEGRPDPGSGYYCYYNEGKLVNSEADVRPSSKKLQ